MYLQIFGIFTEFSNAGNFFNLMLSSSVAHCSFCSSSCFFFLLYLLVCLLLFYLVGLVFVLFSEVFGFCLNGGLDYVW